MGKGEDELGVENLPHACYRLLKNRGLSLSVHFYMILPATLSWNILRSPYTVRILALVAALMGRVSTALFFGLGNSYDVLHVSFTKVLWRLGFCDHVPSPLHPLEQTISPHPETRVS